MSERYRGAIYAGSFDPPTDGHLWMIEKALEIFPELTIVVGDNPSKKGKYMFTQEERVNMMQTLVAKMSNVKVMAMGNSFLIDFAIKNKIFYIIRGMRSIEDFMAEMGMNDVNSRMNKGVEFVYLIPPFTKRDISSSVVKGMIGYDNWIRKAKPYVPRFVLTELILKVKEKDGSS